MSKMFCPVCGKYVVTYVFIGRCPNCQNITEFFPDPFAAAERRKSRGKKIKEFLDRSIYRIYWFMKIGKSIFSRGV